MIIIIGSIAVQDQKSKSTKITIINDYKYIGEPYLLGTVALGGVVNVLPILYEYIPKNKSTTYN